MEVEFTGPGIWFIQILGVVSALMAAFVSVDAWRSVRAERLPDTASKLIWAGPQMVFLAAIVVTVIPGVLPGQYRWIVLALTPIAVILQISYLLKVVYPKPDDDSPAIDSAPSEDS